MSSNNSNDYGDGIVLMLLVIAMVILYIYNNYVSDWLFYYWYYTRKPIFYTLNLIDPEIRQYLFSYVEVFKYLGFQTGNISSKITTISEWFTQNTMQELFESELRMKRITASNTLLPFIFLPLTSLIVIIMSNKIIKKPRFTKKFSIETLGVQESKIWPHIKPVIYEYKNFVSMKSLDDDWFAMSPKPIDYLKKNNLLNYYKCEDEKDVDNYNKQVFKLDLKKSYEFFVKELGEVWKDPHSLSIEKKCILAIILTKITREQPLQKETALKVQTKYRSVELAWALSSAYSSVRIIEKKKGKKTIYQKDKNHEKAILAERVKIHKEVELIIEKYFPIEKEVKKSLFKSSKNTKTERVKGSEKIYEIIDKHYYEKCVFSALLDEARKTGVLATAEFIWLKKVNRDLWYMLSQTGRTASFCEISGAWAHYLTEKKVGRKIATPMVHKAIDAADKYLFETHDNYKPEINYKD